MREHRRNKRHLESAGSIVTATEKKPNQPTNRSNPLSRDRIVKVELALRIIRLFQTPQLLQPPRLIAIPRLQRLIPIRIVDIRIERPSRQVARMKHLSRLVAVCNSDIVVIRSGRELEIVRREHIILAVGIRGGVRIDGLHALEGVVFKLDVGAVELGVVAYH